MLGQFRPGVREAAPRMGSGASEDTAWLVSEVMRGISGFVGVRDSAQTGLPGRIAMGVCAYRSPAQDVRMKKVMGLQETSSKPRLPV